MCTNFAGLFARANKARRISSLLMADTFGRRHRPKQPRRDRVARHVRAAREPNNNH